MTKIIRIGIDTSKSVFQLHGVDAVEKPILRKKLRRQQFLAFVAKLDRHESGWKPVAQRIIGLESSARWGTRLFCCHRNT